jgi:ATP-dependent DNA ligase
MRKVESRVRYVGHIEEKGSEFFQLACEHDLEGIVGKWKFGTYGSDEGKTSWVKIKNPN